MTPEEPRPSLRYDQPVVCTRLPPTKEVPSGEYRMQCDPVTRRCLIAPNHELDPEGVETDRPLLRTSYCERYEVSANTRAREDYRFVPAIAEAPPGWYRDEQGRVMQFNFDLHRRIWLGGAWAPLFGGGGRLRQDRIRVDFGIQTEFPGGDEDNRLHRFTLLDTELYLGTRAPGLDVTLVRYDFNVERTVPLFRVTTFFGKPRRFDLGLNLGAWVEALHQESIERGDAELSLLTWGAVHGTLDVWHSKDLVSYVRFRVGPSIERDRTHGLTTLVPTAVFEGDITLDTDGFHHLQFSVEAEKVLLADTRRRPPAAPRAAEGQGGLRAHPAGHQRSAGERGGGRARGLAQRHPERRRGVGVVRQRRAACLAVGAGAPQRSAGQRPVGAKRNARPRTGHPAVRPAARARPRTRRGPCRPGPALPRLLRWTSALGWMRRGGAIPRASIRATRCCSSTGLQGARWAHGSPRCRWASCCAPSGRAGARACSGSTPTASW